jgi:hypothetical protein
MVTSAIVGLFRVVERIPPGDVALPSWKVPQQIGNRFDYHPLPTPIPCRGAQGLWTVLEDIERQIREAMPDVFGADHTNPRSL